jgi:hypothetical protein
MAPQDFHHLLDGNVEKMGNVASVFQLEYSKLIDKLITKDKKISARLMNTCEKLAYSIFKRELATYQGMKKLSDDDKKMVNNITKAMAALKPSSPKSLKLSQTWNYTKGLTPQELAHEYSRLTGLAAGPPDAGAVRAPKPGGPGVLHPADERGSEAEEIQEDSGLSADGETA